MCVRALERARSRASLCLRCCDPVPAASLRPLLRHPRRAAAARARAAAMRLVLVRCALCWCDAPCAAAMRLVLVRCALCCCDAPCAHTRAAATQVRAWVGAGDSEFKT